MSHRADVMQPGNVDAGGMDPIAPRSFGRQSPDQQFTQEADRETLFTKQSKTSKPQASSASEVAPGSSWLKCPHCAFEIDPRSLEQLRVPPEAVTMQVGAWEPEEQVEHPGVTMEMARLQQRSLPPGTIVRGQVPLSFLQGPHNWYAGQAATK
eukprot:CAMPEP_0117537152 /NCGR_PEP_ID=MMETSP0784-20121206/41818_1 /TAXON_ID=39447 /ORGANISM="" /LENGTH=152 /DNA_ID=CAMNT_0005333731 /DNA_START=105 /DNA_END=563 /DNA_ORIENTATION=+